MPTIEDEINELYEAPGELPAQATPTPEPEPAKQVDAYDHSEVEEQQARFEAEKEQTVNGTGDAYSADAEPKQDGQQSAEPVAARQVFDERLLLDAEYMGIPREMAQRFSSPQDLEMALWSRQQAFSATQHTERQAPPQREDDEFTKALKELDAKADDYDPVLRTAIKGLIERNAKLERATVASMSAEARRIEELRTQQDKAETEQWDRMFNDSDMSDLFGKGSYYGERNEMSQAQLANRERIAFVAETLAQGYQRRGDKVPGNAELMKRAVRAEFGDIIQQKAQQDLAVKVQQRSKQIIPRTTSNSASSPKSAWEKFNALADKVLGNSQDERTEDIFA